jgi:hypothetical protein
MMWRWRTACWTSRGAAGIVRAPEATALAKGWIAHGLSRQLTALRRTIRRFESRKNSGAGHDEFCRPEMEAMEQAAPPPVPGEAIGMIEEVHGPVVDIVCERLPPLHQALFCAFDGERYGLRSLSPPRRAPRAPLRCIHRRARARPAGIRQRRRRCASRSRRIA